MSSGIVDCPGCGTRFRVTSAQLDAAAGLVRCGACLTVFRAADHQVDGAGTESPPPARVGASDVRQAGRHRSVLSRPEESLPDRVPELDPVSLNLDAEVLRQGELDPADPAPTRRRWPWALLVVLGLVALPAQYLHRNLDALVLDPEARPWLERACGLFGCELPAPVVADAIRSQRLTVQSHPQRDDGLRVEVVLVNRASWPQPFPGIELRFSDLQGAPVAARVFHPAEYLGGELTGRRTMPTGTPVRISLDLVDPGPDALNYAMQLHPGEGS
jgi:predicted Zn finger-like uncharacterized protein